MHSEKLAKRQSLTTSIPEETIAINSNGVDEHETTDEDDEDDTISQKLNVEAERNDEESSENPVSQTNLNSMAPMSSISEVTLANVC